MKCLIVITCALAATAAALEVDPGSPTSRTPYDGYLSTMRTVMSSLGSNHPDEGSVQGYVRTARGFRYSMKDPFVPQTPAETESTKSGDCKAKSLWVAYKMDDRTLRFVVGKARASSTMNHAWLVWDGPEGWQVLDATNYSSPLNFSRLGSNEFIPLYSFTANGKYVHAAALAPKKAETRYADHG
jgi:hypothetical protein